MMMQVRQGRVQLDKEVQRDVQAAAGDRQLRLRHLRGPHGRGPPPRGARGLQPAGTTYTRDCFLSFAILVQY
jgi:hypothetical protein